MSYDSWPLSMRVLSHHITTPPTPYYQTLPDPPYLPFTTLPYPIRTIIPNTNLTNPINPIPINPIPITPT